MGLYYEDTSGIVHDMVLSEDRRTLYIAYGLGGLVILDTSDSNHPVKIASKPLRDTNSAPVPAESLALVMNGTMVVVGGSTSGLTSRLLLVDVTDPRAPVTVSSAEMGAQMANQGFVSGDVGLLRGLVKVDAMWYRVAVLTTYNMFWLDVNSTHPTLHEYSPTGWTDARLSASVSSVQGTFLVVTAGHRGSEGGKYWDMHPAATAAQTALPSAGFFKSFGCAANTGSIYTRSDTRHSDDVNSYSYTVGCNAQDGRHGFAQYYAADPRSPVVNPAGGPVLERREMSIAGHMTAVAAGFHGIVYYSVVGGFAATMCPQENWMEYQGGGGDPLLYEFASNDSCWQVFYSEVDATWTDAYTAQSVASDAVSPQYDRSQLRVVNAGPDHEFVLHSVGTQRIYAFMISRDDTPVTTTETLTQTATDSLIECQLGELGREFDESACQNVPETSSCYVTCGYGYSGTVASYTCHPNSTITGTVPICVADYDEYIEVQIVTAGFMETTVINQHVRDTASCLTDYGAVPWTGSFPENYGQQERSHVGMAKIVGNYVMIQVNATGKDEAAMSSRVRSCFQEGANSATLGSNINTVEVVYVQATDRINPPICEGNYQQLFPAHVSYPLRTESGERVKYGLFDTGCVKLVCPGELQYFLSHLDVPSCDDSCSCAYLRVYYHGGNATVCGNKIKDSYQMLKLPFSREVVLELSNIGYPELGTGYTLEWACTFPIMPPVCSSLVIDTSAPSRHAGILYGAAGEPNRIVYPALSDAPCLAGSAPPASVPNECHRIRCHAGAVELSFLYINLAGNATTGCSLGGLQAYTASGAVLEWQGPAGPIATVCGRVPPPTLIAPDGDVYVHFSSTTLQDSYELDWRCVRSRLPVTSCPVIDASAGGVYTFAHLSSVTTPVSECLVPDCGDGFELQLNWQLLDVGSGGGCAVRNVTVYAEDGGEPIGVLCTSSPGIPRISARSALIVFQLTGQDQVSLSTSCVAPLVRAASDAYTSVTATGFDRLAHASEQSYITSDAACRQAAIWLDQRWDSARKTLPYGTGCLSDGASVFFNVDPNPEAKLFTEACGAGAAGYACVRRLNRGLRYRLVVHPDGCAAVGLLPVTTEDECACGAAELGLQREPVGTEYVDSEGIRPQGCVLTGGTRTATFQDRGWHSCTGHGCVCLAPAWHGGYSYDLPEFTPDACARVAAPTFPDAPAGPGDEEALGACDVHCRGRIDCTHYRLLPARDFLIGTRVCQLYDCKRPQTLSLVPKMSVLTDSTFQAIAAYRCADVIDSAVSPYIKNATGTSSCAGVAAHGLCDTKLASSTVFVGDASGGAFFYRLCPVACGRCADFKERRGRVRRPVHTVARSGSCASHGLARVTSLEDCEGAVRVSLDLPTAARRAEPGPRPPGCHLAEADDGAATWDFVPASTADAGAPCERCVCVVAPARASRHWRVRNLDAIDERWVVNALRFYSDEQCTRDLLFDLDTSAADATHGDCTGDAWPHASASGFQTCAELRAAGRCPAKLVSLGVSEPGTVANLCSCCEGVQYGAVLASSWSGVPAKCTPTTGVAVADPLPLHGGYDCATGAWAASQKGSSSGRDFLGYAFKTPHRVGCVRMAQTMDPAQQSDTFLLERRDDDGLWVADAVLRGAGSVWQRTVPAADAADTPWLRHGAGCGAGPGGGLRTLSPGECEGLAAVAKRAFFAELTQLMKIAGVPRGCFEAPGLGFFHGADDTVPLVNCSDSQQCVCGQLGHRVGAGACKGTDPRYSAEKYPSFLLPGFQAPGVDPAHGCLPVLAAAGDVALAVSSHGPFCLLHLRGGNNMSHTALGPMVVLKASPNGTAQEVPQITDPATDDLSCWVLDGAGAGHPPPARTGVAVGCNMPVGNGVCAYPAAPQAVGGLKVCRCPGGFLCSYYAGYCAVDERGACDSPPLSELAEDTEGTSRGAAVLGAAPSLPQRCGEPPAAGALCGADMEPSPAHGGACRCPVSLPSCRHGRCVARLGCGHAVPHHGGCSAGMVAAADGTCACDAGSYCAEGACVTHAVLRRQASVTQSGEDGWCGGNVTETGCADGNTFVQDGVCRCVGGVSACRADGVCSYAAPGTGRCLAFPAEGVTPCADPLAFVDVSKGTCACPDGPGQCNQLTGMCTGACVDSCDALSRKECLCTDGAAAEGSLCRCRPDSRCETGVCVAHPELDTLYLPIVACEEASGGMCDGPALCQSHCASNATYIDGEGLCRCVAGSTCNAATGFCLSTWTTGFCNQNPTPEGTCVRNASLVHTSGLCACHDGLACGVNGMCKEFDGTGRCGDVPTKARLCVHGAAYDADKVICACQRGYKCRSGECRPSRGSGWCNGRLLASGEVRPRPEYAVDFSPLGPSGECAGDYMRVLMYRGDWVCFCEWGFECALHGGAGKCYSTCSGPPDVLRPNVVSGNCECSGGETCDPMLRLCSTSATGTPCDQPCDGCTCTEHAEVFSGICRCAAGFTCDTLYRICRASEYGIAPCGEVSGPGGCAKLAFPDSEFVCRCGTGYVCAAGDNPGQCRAQSVDKCASVRDVAVSGACRCDLSDNLGFWTGTVCDTCAADYFGTSCKRSCKLSYLPSYLWGVLVTADQRCRCPQNQDGSPTYGFEGDLCDTCRPERGKFGLNCSQELPEAIKYYPHSMEAYAVAYVGPVAVLSYSVVRVQITMLGGSLVGALQGVTLRIAQTYNADPATTAASDTVVVCGSQAGWDPLANVASCSVQVPRTNTPFAVVAVENQAAFVELRVELRGVSECCSGHGFCGSNARVCECASHADLGFWSEEAECASCRAGYTGRYCQEFEGSFHSAYTVAPDETRPTPFLGESTFYALDITPETPYRAELNGTGDCDLAVSFIPGCPEGWEENAGSCYKLATDACLSEEEAQAKCAAEGSTLAALTGEVSELEFLYKLFLARADDLVSSDTCPHGDKVFIDLAQAREPLCANVTTQAACDAEATCVWDSVNSQCDTNAAKSCYSSSGRTSGGCRNIGDRIKVGGSHYSKQCFWNAFDAPIDEGSNARDEDRLDSYGFRMSPAFQYAIRPERGMCEPMFKFKYTSDDTSDERAARLAQLEGFLLKHSVAHPECSGTRHRHKTESDYPPTCTHPQCLSSPCICIQAPRRDSAVQQMMMPMMPMLDGPACSALCDGVESENGWSSFFDENKGALRTLNTCPQTDGQHYACTRREVDQQDTDCHVPEGCDRCRYSGASAFARSAVGQPWNMSAWDPSSTDTVRKLCTVLGIDPTKTTGAAQHLLRGLPAYCTNIFADGATYSSSAPKKAGDVGNIGAARYLCKQPIPNLQSTKTGTGYRKILSVGGDESQFINSDCYNPEVFNTTSDVCFGAVPKAKNHMVMRVTCLEIGSSFNLSVEYIPKGIFKQGTLGACVASNDGGHWRGVFCNTCQERWEGESCNEFNSCATDERQCDQGTCNSGNGMCVCKADYYGTHCESYCTALDTCNGLGTCNIAYGTGNSLCLCNDNVEGQFCDTCSFGFYGELCTSVCTCSDLGSIGCDRVNGACECYSSVDKGHFAGAKCNECQDEYYGVACTTFCNNATTCGGHGGCDSSGACVCSANRYGTSCSIYCASVIDSCNHGTCTTDGLCSCGADYTGGFWAGDSCSECMFGYWGEECKFDCQCSMNGACDARSGQCECYADDVNGFWAGTECNLCADGWRGDSCATPVGVVQNKLSAAGNLIVNASARSSKTYEHLQGDIIIVNSTLGTTECGASAYQFMYAMAGTDVSMWQRPCTGSTWANWVYVSTCNLYSRLGYGVDIVRAVYSEGTLFVAVRGATQSAIVWFKASGTPTDASPGEQCTASGTASVTSRSLKSFVNDAASPSQYVIDMGLDAYHQSLYVLLQTATTATPSEVTNYLTKVPLNVSDWETGSQHLQTKVELHAFVKVTALRMVDENKYYPYVLVMGGGASRVLVSKIFIPTDFVDERARSAEDGPALTSIRSVFTFTPAMCFSVSCEKIVQHHVVDGWLFVAAQTLSKGTRGVALGRIFVDAIKRVDLFGVQTLAEDWTGSEMGVGFMAFDSPSNASGASVLTGRREHIYLGTRNSTPSQIRKYHAADFVPEAPAVQLNFENVATSYQSAVAAWVDSAERLLYIVLKLPRLQVLLMNLYDVESIAPTMVDGTGGTTVVVTGRGFPDQDPFCRFGSIVVSGANSVKRVNDRTITCKAPKVPTYDACKDVPLEISFGTAERFTENGVLVRHISLPLVFSLRPDKGTLVPTEPITLQGTGFLDSSTIACQVADVVTKATWLSTLSMLCEQPPLKEPRVTTVEVSMDGQKFSQSGVVYSVIGNPSKMAYSVRSCFAPAGCPDFVPESSADLYSEVSDETTRLKNVTVRFYDNADNFVGIRDDLVRGGNLTLELISHTPAPKGPQWDVLFGTLTKPIENGEATFDDLYFRYPGAGLFKVAIRYDAAPPPHISPAEAETEEGAEAAALAAAVRAANITIPDILFEMKIDARATRLSFVSPPATFSSNKEKLTTQPVLMFSDVSENVVTGASGNMRVVLLLTPDQRLPVKVRDDTGRPCWWPSCQIYEAAPDGVILPAPTLEGHLAADYEFRNGVVTYQQLRIQDAAPGYNYTLRFEANGILEHIESKPITIAVCHSTNNDPIYALQPNNGQLGAMTVTVKGWGFREEEEASMFCRYGDDPPVKTIFVDTCTMLCPLGAKVQPRSASLEITYTADMVAKKLFTTLGFIYDYIDVVHTMRMGVETGKYSFQSETLLTFDPIVASLHDAAGNWLRHWDTETRVVFLKTRLPIVTAPLRFEFSDAKLTITGVAAQRPANGLYTMLLTSDGGAALPLAIGNVAAPTTSETSAPASNGTAPVDGGAFVADDDPCHYPLNCTLDSVCWEPADGSSCAKNCACRTQAACEAHANADTKSRGCVWADDACRIARACVAKAYRCTFDSLTEGTPSLTESLEERTANASALCTIRDAYSVQGGACVHLNTTDAPTLAACVRDVLWQRGGDWGNYEEASGRCVVLTGSCETVVIASGWVASRPDCNPANSVSLTELATLSASGSAAQFEGGGSGVVGNETGANSTTATLTATSWNVATLTGTRRTLTETELVQGEGGAGQPVANLPKDACVRDCISTHPPRPSSEYVVAASFVVQITSGVAVKLQFHTTGAIDPATNRPTDHYSLFTTSKTKLDVQPVVRVSDDAGNTVTAFSAQPLVRVAVVPYCRKAPHQTFHIFDFSTQAENPMGGCLPGYVFSEADLSGSVATYGSSLGPFCHGTRPSSVSLAIWEDQCTRVKGDSSPVLNGRALFNGIFFRGERTIKYKMVFTLSNPVLPPLESELIRVPDCTCATTLCGTEPAWALLTGGNTITLRGWDFQPQRSMKVNLAGRRYGVKYIDTCTASVTIASAAAARDASVMEAASEEWDDRSALTQQGASSGSFGLQLVDVNNVDFTSEPVKFRMKQPIPYKLGIVEDCGETFVCPMLNQSIPDSSVRCRVDTTDDSPVPKRCFETDSLVHIGEVLVALQDDGGGDLIQNMGFDPAYTQEVEVTLIVMPPKTETRRVERIGDQLIQKQCDAIRGEACAGSVLNATRKAWTEYGLLRIQDITLELPRTGTYLLNFTTNAVNSKNIPIASGALRIVVAVNKPHSFEFAEPPLTTTDGSVMLPAPSLAVKDIASNPLADADLPKPIEVQMSLVAHELLTMSSRPRRLVSGIHRAERWTAKVYQEQDLADQIIPTGIPARGEDGLTTLTNGVSRCQPSDGGSCWYPPLSFLPADLGGNPNYVKMLQNRQRDLDFDPPFYSGGDSQLSKTAASITSAAKADYKGLIISNVWHGVVYEVTYRITQQLYSFLPPVSHNLTRNVCPPVDGKAYFALNFSTHCLPCPQGAACDGTVWLRALVGWWRSSETDIQFYECQGANCDRANRRLAGDDLCIEGTMGPVCAVCRPNWGKQGTGCTKCPALWQSVAVVLAVVAAILIVIVVLVKVNLAGGGKVCADSIVYTQPTDAHVHSKNRVFPLS